MPSVFPRNAAPQRAQVPFSDQALAILGPAVCRALTDHHHDTKKKGAKEIEDVINFVQQKDIGVAREKTVATIGILVSEFIGSEISKEYQIGGLLGLVGVARGLREETKYYLSQLVIPVVKLFQSGVEPSIKYYSAECLYNMCLIDPADIIVFLDDMVAIVFKMWPESEKVLQSGAGYLDSVLRKLAADYAASSQLTPLVKRVLAQLNSTISTQPPIYLLPWVQFLLSKHANSGLPSADSSFKFPAHQAIAPMLRMLNAKLNDDHLRGLDRLIGFAATLLNKEDAVEPSDNWSYDLEARLESLMEDPATTNHGPYVKLMLELCGVPEESINLDDQNSAVFKKLDEVFIERHSTFVLNFELNLLAASNSYNVILRKFNDTLKQIVFQRASKEALEAIGRTAAEALEAATSKLTPRSETVAEITLGWIRNVASHRRDGNVLSSKSFSAVVGLVSSDRESIRKEAIDCIAKLCEMNEETSLIMLSSSALKIHGSKSLRTLESYISLLDSLIATKSNWLASLTTAFEAVPAASYGAFYRRHLAVFAVILSAFNGSCQAKLGWQESLPDGFKDHFPLQAVLIQLRQSVEGCAMNGEAMSSALRNLMSGSDSYGWIVGQLEILAAMMELSCFAPIRGRPGALSIYATLRSWLPISSPAYAIVNERLRGFDIASLQLPLVNPGEPIFRVPPVTEDDERNVDEADAVFQPLFARALKPRRSDLAPHLPSNFGISSKRAMFAPHPMIGGSTELEKATCQPTLTTASSPSELLEGRRELVQSPSIAFPAPPPPHSLASTVPDAASTAGSTVVVRSGVSDPRSEVAQELAVSHGSDLSKTTTPVPTKGVMVNASGNRSVETRGSVEDLATAAHSSAT